MGGEKGAQPAEYPPSRGSPPRGRGKVSKSPMPFNFRRITPAWAGKSRLTTGHLLFHRDHPRVGGEKPFLRKGLRFAAGSPPRGRGKVWQSGRSLPESRITPAWAGKSSKSICVNTPVKDHPRVGGEKTICSRIMLAHLWITPAWAGKSCPICSVAFWSWDHPRVGGEKIADYMQVSVGEGSPPRGRGKGYNRTMRLCNTRITPAWAGKRQRSADPAFRKGDHPRVGGEKSAKNE